MNRIEVFKETLDDWYPNYHGNLVRVTFHGNIASPEEDTPYYRVSVWGADDCGMEYDTESERVAHTIFMEVIGLKTVNWEELSELGFVSA